jgi:uncharacterized protein with NRDE domain
MEVLDDIENALLWALRNSSPSSILQSETSLAAITIIRSNHEFNDYYYASRTFLVAILVRIDKSFFSY